MSNLRAENKIKKEWTHQPIALLYIYTGLRQVVRSSWLPKWSIFQYSFQFEGIKHPKIYACMATFIVPASVFVQSSLCLNVCISNNGTVTKQYLQK